jgi:hypothetical protein
VYTYTYNTHVFYTVVFDDLGHCRIDTSKPFGLRV